MTFLANHANQIAAVDFFTIPMINFRVLYCFIVLLHGRRKIVHFNVTANPTAQWAAQQIIEAFPDDTSARYLLRDRDSIYGAGFQSRLKGMQIEEVVTAPHSPFQNPYVERVIGSIRRDCLDHLIVLNEDHLRRILRGCFKYYHDSRPHQCLERNAPEPREIEPPSQGKIIAMPQVGGGIIGIAGPRNIGATAGPRDDSTRIDRRRIASKDLLWLITNQASAEYDTNRNYEVEIGFGTINKSCLYA